MLFLCPSKPANQSTKLPSTFTIGNKEPVWFSLEQTAKLTEDLEELSLMLETNISRISGSSYTRLVKKPEKVMNNTDNSWRSIKQEKKLFPPV